MTQQGMGGCLCGAVRYRLSATPISSVVCHCVSCRKASGAPSVGWLTVDRTQLQITGAASVYSSSAGVMRRFCAVCGSPLSYENSSSPQTIDVTTATLDHPDAFPPTMEVWLDHRLSWHAAAQNREHCPTGGGPDIVPSFKE